MKVALYARVSKRLEQNPENQLIALREWAKANDHEIEGEYIDEISSRDTRPSKEAVLKLLRLGYIDGVAFYSLDRWGRNMTELVLELDEFKTAKCLISLKEGIDLSTSAGRLAAHIFAAMANFERDRIQERTMLGLARARAQGKHLGRPKRIG
jgi:DNA invertase Pin-like site-specific DNA recombinase